VRRAAQLKGEPAPIDEILDLDRLWREHLTVAESNRAQQNQLSKIYATSKSPTDLRTAKELGEEAKKEMAEAEALKRQLDDLLLRVPNLFHESVPVGEGEQDNVVLRDWGLKADLGFAPRTHYDLGEALGIMDFERAAKVAGSRFAFLIGEGARLERALAQFMLDVHTGEHGYTEVWPPMLVNSASGHGQPAQIRGRRIQSRRPGPVAGADVGGPAHQPPPRGDPRRRSPAAQVHRVHAVLPL
jgi:seryl-tRNA synthetase